jgi:hypothetical protein
MRKLWIVFFLVTVTAHPLYAQDTIKHQIVPAKIIDGDTVPYVDLKTIVVFPQVATISSLMELAGYERLVYNVRKVYPYAKMAGQLLKEYKRKLDSIPTERARRKFLKQAEKELDARFGKEIRDMNFTQGKILIKLIYRETGSSTFGVLKELRGGFNAFIYQTMAKLFGYDLKSVYDPEGDDKMIERVVRLIEDGTL